MFTAKQLSQKYEQFRQSVNDNFPTRSIELGKMYDYFEDRLVTMPASGVEHYHNAFPGGYIDHVMRVVEFSLQEYELWTNRGLITDNFTQEELVFAAYHHHLGKVGLPGEYNPYQPNPSEWHRKNQGKIYSHDPKQPFMLVPDASLFNLQYFGVRTSWSEYLAIRTHDGVYDRANEAYYFAGQLDTKPRTNINQILHNADYAAARWEFERWAKQNPTKFHFFERPADQPDTNKKVEVTPDDFDSIFGED